MHWVPNVRYECTALSGCVCCECRDDLVQVESSELLLPFFGLQSVCPFSSGPWRELVVFLSAAAALSMIHLFALTILHRSYKCLFECENSSRLSVFGTPDQLVRQRQPGHVQSRLNPFSPQFCRWVGDCASCLPLVHMSKCIDWLPCHVVGWSAHCVNKQLSILSH